MSTNTLLTIEEFLNLPDVPGKQELFNGELISLPPAKRSHMEISKRLVDLFALYSTVQESGSGPAINCMAACFSPMSGLPGQTSKCMMIGFRVRR
jgi:Uma2 family endonuclease